MNYTVIPRNEIPPTPPAKQERYGEWLAMARHMKLLKPEEAVRVELGQLNAASVAVSIYCAARRVGIKVSTMRVGGHIYAVRTGVQKPVGKAPMKFTCKHCREVCASSQPKQQYCKKQNCQKARKLRNNRELRERRKRGF